MDTNLLSNIQKLFSERIDVFSPVEFNKVCSQGGRWSSLTPPRPVSSGWSRSPAPPGPVQGLASAMVSPHRCPDSS